jgi:hypothetical protein
MGKHASPFSLEFWLSKGLTPEEAEYKRNSIRPIKKEYWMEKGFSEEEATALAKNKKEQNNRAGAEKSKNRTQTEIRQANARCVEYWIHRYGQTPEEARLSVSRQQSTFSLEKCVLKYGVEEGQRIWSERQQKWQDTLNSKSTEERKIIDKKKKSIILYDNVPKSETISILKRTRNMDLVETTEQLINKIENDLRNNPLKRYYLIEKYIDDIPTIQFEIIGEDSTSILPKIKDLFSKKTNLLKRGNRQAWRRWEKEGLLRSSFEIYFYDRFTDKFPDKEIKIDKKYPNSSMRYDFSFDDKFVEICPLYGVDKKYTTKMQKKKQLFGCVLLSNIEQIDRFIDTYENNIKKHN